MKRLFCIFLLVVATVSSAAPLTKYQNLSTAMRSTVSDQGLFVKGLGENNWYAFEVDPATGAWPVSGSFSLSNDTNYGVVGANTLRGAAQIGNATGAADFGAGNSSAQTLRAVIATNQSALPASQSGTWTVQPGNTANTTPWLATVSQGGNSATVSAGGALKVDGSAATQPVSGTVAVTQSTSPWVVSQSGTWTVQPGNTANTTPWLATVSQGGNSATVSAGGALKVDGSAATQPVSGTVAATQSGNWSTRTQDGSGNAITSTSSRLDVNVGAASGLDFNTGLAGATTLRVIPGGRASTTTTVATYDYTGGTVTTAAYTQIIASTTNAMNRLHVFDSSGSAIIIATGAVASEVDRIYLPPGGQPAVYEINIPASTRVSIKALDTNASTGRLILTGLN